MSEPTQPDSPPSNQNSQNNSPVNSSIPTPIPPAGSTTFSQPENEILTDLVIERHLFDWIFISSIFGVLSIGLYGLTSNRYVWGSLGLMLVIGLLIIALTVYWDERKRLMEEGKTPRKRTDALAIIVLILIFILIAVIWNIIMEYLVFSKHAY